MCEHDSIVIARDGEEQKFIRVALKRAIRVNNSKIHRAVNAVGDRNESVLRYRAETEGFRKALDLIQGNNGKGEM